MIERFPWIRFWLPRASAERWQGRGFLPDPEDPFGVSLAPDAVQLDRCAERPCLILLGEPGLGKSDEVNRASAAGRKAANVGDEHRFFDLKLCSDPYLLDRQIFKASWFEAWRGGANTLWLWLDALDECQLQVRFAAQLIGEQLALCPIERLRFRITCRSGDWSPSLEETMRAKWGEEGVGVLNLAPLRAGDVFLAARQSGIDAEVFFRAVTDRRIEPLAARPITLRFLLDAFAANGQLPESSVELYERGCHALCEENNLIRREVSAIGALDVGQRLAVASRIAAVSVFSAAPVILVNGGAASLGELTLESLAGGTETFGGNEFPVTESVLRETLRLGGLFQAAGANRLTWAHRTFSEFLAARYLREREVPVEAARTLLMPEGELVPQLVETAAWSAQFLPRLFDDIAMSQPTLLLRHPESLGGDTQRSVVVEALLSHPAQAQHSGELFGHERLGRLRHPGLAGQLAPYLAKDRPFLARHLAIRIAGACQVVEMAAVLAQLAADADSENSLRAAAAEELAHFEDAALRMPLKEVLNHGCGDNDRDDQLRAACVRGLWPGIIAPSELFAALTPPRRSNFHGDYDRLLSDHIASHLQTADLPAALAWAAPISGGDTGLDALGSLSRQILWLGWKNVLIPGVLGPFADALSSRLSGWQPFLPDGSEQEFRSEWATRSTERRAVMAALFDRLGNLDEHYTRLMYFGLAPTADDVGWVLECFDQENEPTRKRWLARFVVHWLRRYKDHWSDTEVHKRSEELDRAANLPRFRVASLRRVRPRGGRFASRICGDARARRTKPHPSRSCIKHRPTSCGTPRRRRSA